MSRPFVATVALIVAIAGPAASAAPKAPPKATPAGPALDCVQLNAIRDTRVRDDRTIDFVMTNGKIYRNTLPNACPGLGFEQSFSYATSLSQLCSVDIITVLRRGGGMMRGASCGLGTFQPVTLPDPKR